MEYELTQHAESVLAERGIALDWLERVLATPEKTESDSINGKLEHRLGRIAEHGNRVLRVVFKPSATPMRIITAYFDRTMRGKL